MGERPFRVYRGALPDRLWIWEKNVYVDEKRRTWLPITIQTESGRQVLMRQEDVPLGQAMCPSQLSPLLLPLMWQLYPGRRYRSSNSDFWRIVCHIQFRGIEDLLLEELPEPECE